VITDIFHCVLQRQKTDIINQYHVALYVGFLSRFL